MSRRQPYCGKINTNCGKYDDKEEVMCTKMNKLFISYIIICLCCLWCVNLGNAETLGGVEILSGVWQGESVEYLADEILVGLESGETEAGFSGELGSIPATIVRNDDGTGFLKLRVNTGQDMFNIIDQVNQLPSVQYAEPNLIDHSLVTPNDPEFSKQWSYHNIGQVLGRTADADIDAPEGWDISTGSTTIRVGVLDGGISIQNGSLNHPDLDDTSRFLLGYDFGYNDSIPDDKNGHGTHVTGIIAAETDNGVGIAGVCWNVQIMAIKVFGDDGKGTHEMFKRGCYYAIDNGCQIINYSGGGPASSTKYAGVRAARRGGVIICAGAGNGNGGAVIWPAAYATVSSNCIAVSSTNHKDGFSSFSSKGPEITVSAPGGFSRTNDGNGIYSTLAIFSSLPIYPGKASGSDIPKYGYKAGTSMACPHVAGLAALILSMDSSLTPSEVREIIKCSADDLGVSGRDDYFGWGRINVQRALLTFGRGDANNDGRINVGDAVYLLSYVMKTSGLPPVPHTLRGDVNCDGRVNVGDVVYILNYIFRKGPAPAKVCCEF